MGVSLGYCTNQPVQAEDHRRILALVAEANDAYLWWCEAMWMDDDLDEAGHAYGMTKLFCLIDDVDTDTYMAYLDINEIVKILSSISTKLGIGWRLEIEDSPFGMIIQKGPDAELKRNLSSFLNLSSVDLKKFQSRSRADILAEWAGR